MTPQKIRKAYKAWKKSWSPLLPGRGAAFAAGAKWALAQVEESLLKTQSLPEGGLTPL